MVFGPEWSVVERGQGQCRDAVLATRSALTSIFSTAGRSPLVAGCSPLRLRSTFVLGFSCAYVRVIIIVGRIIGPAHRGACRCRLDSHSSVASKRTLLEAVAVEAVATPSVRPCEYATRARAGTLVRRAHFSFDDVVDY